MLTTMIDYLRFALYAVLIVLLLAFYQTWEKEHPNTINLPQTKPALTENYIPDIKTDLNATAKPIIKPTPIPTTVSNAHTIKVKTDVFSIDINTLGGNITTVKLLKYPQTLHSETPYLLLNNDPDTKYIAQSGLLSNQGPDTSEGQALYSTEHSEYSLSPTNDHMEVNLTWQNNAGLKVIKSYLFTKNSYDIGLKYQIINTAQTPWQGNLYLQLLRKDTPPPNGQGLSNLTTFFGAAISSPEKPFQKLSFSDIAKQNLSQTITDGWAAMVQHYFVSAWIPAKAKAAQYFTKVTSDNLYSVGIVEPTLTVPANATITTTAHLYSGPAISERLQKAAPNLNLTIDYGWFWFISVIIFWMMQKIYYLVGNWGWSIVFVTVIIKILFYHLSAKSYRSMSALKKLQPKLEELKTKFGDDKQKFTQATMELYRKEKVNPMSGCLPILIQIPVFIALYWVLVEAVELRHAPFILWIHDLSAKDPYYILPILVGASMLLQQLISPPPPDPTQAKVMMLMPVIFTFLFINFPAGLMLYWFVNNTLSMLQQWYIMKTVENSPIPKKKK